MRIIVGFCLSLVFCMVAAGPARADIQVMEFTNSGFGNGSYFEKGFTLTPTIVGNHFNDNGGATYFDFHSGSANTPVNNFLITSAGGAFDFLSFDVLANPDGLVFTSNLGDTFIVQPGTIGSFNLPVSFQNITSVEIGYVNELANTYYQILDNLRFNDVPTVAAVPEPTTLAVWSIVGLIGAAHGWRRRRAHQTLA